MGGKKNKSRYADKRVKPSASNDQLGENAGEGKFEREVSKNCKNK